MNYATVYHRPESEFAYIEDKQIVLRVRIGKGQVENVNCIWGDPYDFEKKNGKNLWQFQSASMTIVATTEYFDYWEVKLRPLNSRIQYLFQLINSKENILYGDSGFNENSNENIQNLGLYFKLPYLHEIDAENSPTWIGKTVWYQIFPERFANGDKNNDPINVLPWNFKTKPTPNSFFGGDLQGIIDHLDYLKKLGINGIYLCPIFKSTSNHKYNTMDYFQIDPNFGNKEKFHQLVNEAHKRDIRIMLDAVFNHIGSDSVQWQDVLKRNSQSRYFDWFYIHQLNTDNMREIQNEFKVGKKVPYDAFGYSAFMPKLNTENPEVEKYLLDVAKYWIKEFDIDGWRLDVANEVDHHFWRQFAEMCHQLKPDFYILGEVWNSARSWLQGDQFSGVMNYAFTSLIKEGLIEKKYSGKQFLEKLSEQEMQYSDPVNRSMMNILDSHDTTRLLNDCKNDKDLERMVLAFTFVQRGTPCIYYGDEIGMTGEEDPDNRKCMNWNENTQDRKMLKFVTDLIKFRKLNFQYFTSGKRKSQIQKDLIKLNFELKKGQLIAYFNNTNEVKKIYLKMTDKILLCQNYGQKELKKNGFVMIRRS